MSDALRWGVAAAEAAILAWFLALQGAQLLLLAAAVRHLRRRVRVEHPVGDVAAPTGLEPPVSILVPAFNEEATIAVSVRSLLQLVYPEFEVVVVNDGSSDGTLDVLRREFDLVAVPATHPARIPTRTVRGVWRSRAHPNLRVVDKENGRKADALNAGINVARSELLLAIDGDSILQRESLLRMVQPFLEDPDVVACGGTVRVANGCSAAGGMLAEVGLPRNPLALFQTVEYLRAFLVGRTGWADSNALLIISGAFGLFRRDAVAEAGGFRHDTIGEDMELTVRLHHAHRAARRPYRVVFVADPVCWTEVPESLRVLARQRIRWQRGLSESLWAHRDLLFARGSGAVGWLAFPYFVAFEWLGPVVEAAGYVFTAVGWATGLLSPDHVLLFLSVAVGLGVVHSTAALVLEEYVYHAYRRATDVLVLFAAAVLENLGYRQLTVVWRLMGLWSWAAGKKAQWGAMTRSGAFGRRA